MNRTLSYWLPFAFLATLIAGFLGMSWNILEPRMSFPMGTKVMLVAAVGTAAISRMGGRSPALLTTIVIGMAVPCGAFLAMLVSMFKDPTSQNLWPIALVTLAVPALVASSVGTLFGSLLLPAWRRISPDKSDT